MIRIILIVSGVSVFLFVLAAYLMLTEKSRQVGKRLKEVTEFEDRAIAEAVKLRDRSNNQGFLRILGSIFAPKVFRKNIGEELLKADILLRAEEFIGITILAGFTGGVLGDFFNGTGAAIVFSLLGLFVPVIFLNMKKKARMNKLSSQMGDCLTVMTNSLRAGFSFLQTMDQVGKELPAPLGAEFARTTREIGFGLTAEDALKNMAKRLESDDLDLMVTAVLIQRQIGGNLAEILDNISHTIKERVRIKGEIRTLTAQARMSGWIIGLLPVVLFAALTVMSPEYMSLFFQTKMGWMLLGGGVVSELFGVFIISRIVKVEF